jgi:hypothetical protein
MKVNNKEIVIRKNGEQVCKIHNRITNNGLDWFVFKSLNEDISVPLYPQFVYSGAAFTVQNDQFSNVYCKFDTAEILNDTSYDMSYDIIGDFISASEKRVLLDNGIEMVKRSSVEVETAQAGQILQTVGFGGDVDHTSHYLYSYIQVGFLGLTFAEGDIITFERKDIGTTELTIETQFYEGFAKLNILKFPTFIFK